MQDKIRAAQTATPKRTPKLSSSNASYSRCLTEARRHLVTIFRSRGPVSDDEVSNATMNDIITGPMSARVWSFVYELVDLEKGIGDMMERERLKYDLVQELAICIKWEMGMDAQWEASRLVEDVFPMAIH